MKDRLYQIQLKLKLPQAWAWVRRVAGFVPLTPAGLALTLGLLAAVYAQGVQRLDLVALAAGGGLLAVLLIAVFSVVVGTLWLRRHLTDEGSHTFLELVSGREVSSGFSIPYWWYLPLVRISWDTEDFRAHTKLESHQGRLRELLNCRRRGLQNGLTRRFKVSDTLGLSAISWERKSQGQVRVLPNPGRLDQPNILLSLVSGEDLSDPRGDPQGDRVDMRQYQKGDPMKFILWKVYSRSGKVMVRVPERALAARPRACCYLLSGPQDEASAALARVLLEMGLLGEEWRFGADGQAGHTGLLDEALNRVALSGNVDKSRCEGLLSFLKQAENDGYGFCLVLAPPGSKVLSEEVGRCLSMTRMRHEIWVGMDVPEPATNVWLRSLQVLENAPLSPRAVHQAWAGRATLVERESGRVMARTEQLGR